MANVYKQNNSTDNITLKRISRALLKKYGTNEPVLKDDVIKIAKEINPDEKKKFVSYINKFYGNKNKLTQKEFKEVAKPNPGGTIEDPKDEERYQTSQRLYSNEKMNKTLSVVMDSKIAEVYNEYGSLINLLNDKKSLKTKSAFIDMLEKIKKDSHFRGANAFIRYTKVKPDWIHIDAIQTDYFNKFKKFGKEQQLKGTWKKFIGKVISLEEDTYKNALSSVKRKNPKVKIWTMNSPEMAKGSENISSENKLNYFYSILPKKLGFKMITTNKLKKILNTRSGKDEGETKEFKNLLYSDDTLISDLEKTLKYVNKYNKKELDEYLKAGWKSSKELMKNKNLLVDTAGMKLEKIFTNAVKQLGIKQSFKMKKFIKDIKFLVKNTNSSHAKTPEELSTKIFSLLSDKVEFEKNNEETSGSNIWWGNRGMINEEVNYIDNIFESIKL